MLLLELARGSQGLLVSELEGTSWSADLTGLTLSLVRGEVHPALANLSTPAKLLQNAMMAGSNPSGRSDGAAGARRRRGRRPTASAI